MIESVASIPNDTVAQTERSASGHFFELSARLPNSAPDLVRIDFTDGGLVPQSAKRASEDVPESLGWASSTQIDEYRA